MFRLFRSRPCVLLLLGACAAVLGVSQPSPHGIRARPAAADYGASGSLEGVTYAASQVSPDQVKHIFASDISKSYLVFEVAVYPSQQANAQVEPEDFLVKAGMKGEYAHPADGVTVASVVQQKTAPVVSRPAVTPVGEVGVGVGSVTDPATGRKIHTVSTEAGAGVSVGGPSTNPAPPNTTSMDRAILEAQLLARSLPAGEFLAPVAGYLYFPASSLKRHGRSGFELEYQTQRGSKVVLVVPVSK